MLLNNGLIFLGGVSMVADGRASTFYSMLSKGVDGASLYPMRNCYQEMEKEVEIELTSFPPSVAPAPNSFAFSWPFEGGPASFISASAYEVLHITIIRRELLKQLVTKLQERKKGKEKREKKKICTKTTPKLPNARRKKKEKKRKRKKENRQIQKHLKNTIYKLSAQCRSCPEDSSVPELLPKLLRVLLTL